MEIDKLSYELYGLQGAVGNSKLVHLVTASIAQSAGSNDTE